MTSSHEVALPTLEEVASQGDAFIRNSIAQYGESWGAIQQAELRSLFDLRAKVAAETLGIPCEDSESESEYEDVISEATLEDLEEVQDDVVCEEGMPPSLQQTVHAATPHIVFNYDSEATPHTSRRSVRDRRASLASTTSLVCGSISVGPDTPKSSTISRLAKKRVSFSHAFSGYESGPDTIDLTSTYQEAVETMNVAGSHSVRTEIAPVLADEAFGREGELDQTGSSRSKVAEIRQQGFTAVERLGLSTDIEPESSKQNWQKMALFQVEIAPEDALSDARRATTEDVQTTSQAVLVEADTPNQPAQSCDEPTSAARDVPESASGCRAPTDQQQSCPSQLPKHSPARCESQPESCPPSEQVAAPECAVNIGDAALTADGQSISTAKPLEEKPACKCQRYEAPTARELIPELFAALEQMREDIRASRSSPTTQAKESRGLTSERDSAPQRRARSPPTSIAPEAVNPVDAGPVDPPVVKRGIPVPRRRAAMSLGGDEALANAKKRRSGNPDHSTRVPDDPEVPETKTAATDDAMASPEPCDSDAVSSLSEQANQNESTIAQRLPSNPSTTGNPSHPSETRRSTRKTSGRQSSLVPSAPQPRHVVGREEANSPIVVETSNEPPGYRAPESAEPSSRVRRPTRKSVRVSIAPTEIPQNPSRLSVAVPSATVTARQSVKSSMRESILPVLAPLDVPRGSTSPSGLLHDSDDDVSCGAPNDAASYSDDDPVAPLSGESTGQNTETPVAGSSAAKADENMPPEPMMDQALSPSTDSFATESAARHSTSSVGSRLPLGLLSGKKLTTVAVNVSPDDTRPIRGAKAKRRGVSNAARTPRNKGVPLRELRGLNVERARRDLQRDSGKDGTLRRSKRQRFAPLEYYRGETITYERRKSQVLPTIAQIERLDSDTEDDTSRAPSARRQHAARPAKRRKRAAPHAIR